MIAITGLHSHLFFVKPLKAVITSYSFSDLFQTFNTYTMYNAMPDKLGSTKELIGKYMN